MTPRQQLICEAKPPHFSAKPSTPLRNYFHFCKTILVFILAAYGYNTLSMELKDYQVTAVRTHLQLGYSYNCFEMGLGKTYVALKVFETSNTEECLVLCPAYLAANWRDEMLKVWPDTPSIRNRVHIVSYATTKPLPPSQFVICDEFHYVKNPDAKRTRLLYDYLTKVKPPYFVGLSGTPMKKDASDFYAYLEILKLRHPEIATPDNFYKFQAYYCNRVPNNFTPTGYSYSGIRADRVGELKDAIRPYFLVKKARDVLTLPPTVDKNYYAKEKTKRDQLLLKAMEDGRSMEFMAIKNLNAEENTKTTIKLVEDLMYQGKRPVVFTEHRKSATVLAQHFSTSAILGGATNELRVDILRSFSNHEKNVLIGTYGAMGSGLNITTSDTMVFNDYSFIPAEYDQARKRIHRIGQTRQCFYHHVFSSEVDFQIFKRLMSKREDVNKMI